MFDVHYILFLHSGRGSECISEIDCRAAYPSKKHAATRPLFVVVVDLADANTAKALYHCAASCTA
jgi:hypothetical protein